WRIFNPWTGRDDLYLTLPAYPQWIRWDPSFSSVEFVLRGRIVRTNWAMHSKIVELASLPADSCLCDFWYAGTWHVVTQEEVPASLSDGRPYEMQVGRRWDLNPSTKRWHVVVVDSQAGDHYGGCYVTSELKRNAPPPPSIRIESFVDSMSLGSAHSLHL